jgi:hypothetical protein
VHVEDFCKIKLNLTEVHFVGPHYMKLERLWACYSVG